MLLTGNYTQMTETVVTGLSLCMELCAQPAEAIELHQGNLANSSTQALGPAGSAKDSSTHLQSLVGQMQA